MYGTQPRAGGNGLLVERGFVADAPSEVDGLKPGAVLLAQRSQFRKHVALKRIALFLQVLEGRTDKHAECAGGDGHTFTKG
jgi:hypothetical protein